MTCLAAVRAPIFLTGGSGSDTFLLSTAGGDTITDFTVAEDVFLLSSADFMVGLIPVRRFWTVSL